MRRHGLLAAAAATALAASGCSFDGLQSAPLPGTAGTGDDAYVVTVELPDVGTLVENAEVKVDDVAVGTVTDLVVEDWHAKATLSLDPETRLPADAVAKVGYNSLLGAAYLELAGPGGSGSTGVTPDATSNGAVLADGDTIPLERGGAYPSTEQVLAATSVVLNGSGLQQLRTITVELNRALSAEGRAGVRSLIPRLTSFVGALDDQRSDIVTAVERLDRLSSSFEDDLDVVETALDEIEPGLRVLEEQRTSLTEALVAMDELSGVTARLVDRSAEDLRRNLEDLRPALRALVEADEAVLGGLRYLLTPPFAPEAVPNGCRGDYCNLFLNLDVSVGGLVENLLGRTHAGDVGGGDSGRGLLDLVPGQVPGLQALPGLGDLLGRRAATGATTPAASETDTEVPR